jgi:hypothetical protein
MSRVKVRFAASAALLALVLGGASPTSNPTATADPTPTVTFGAVGDIGESTDSTKMLSQITATGTSNFFGLGDYSYVPTSTDPDSEQGFCDMVHDTLEDPAYPFEIVAGNHEDDGPDGFIGNYVKCLPDRLGAVGNYGTQFYVDLPAAAPLVRFIMISPGINSGGKTLSYKANTDEYRWTSSQIDGARTAGIPWVVVGMHYYCLNLSGHVCPIKQDITNLLLEKKVDVYLQAHDHAYARTKQLAMGPACPFLDTTNYNPGCVADGNLQSAYTAGAGTVVATVGSGGVNINKQFDTDPAAPYFASYMGSNFNKTFGFLRFTATPQQLSASFVRGSGGSFTDSFSLTRDTSTDTTPPDTSIDSGPTGAVNTTGASLAFSSSDPSSSFACGLDGAAATPCTSPRTYAGLSEGAHTFSVTATDAAGNSDTSPATRTWTVDTTAPTLTGTSPVDGAAGASTGTTVTGTFSEAISASTLTSDTFTLATVGDTPLPATVTYDDPSHTARLTPTDPLQPGASYTATLRGGSAGVSDAAGNPLSATTTWTFTTSATPTARNLGEVGRATSSTSGRTLTITTSRAVSAGTAVVLAMGYSGAPNVGVTVADSNGNTWTLDGRKDNGVTTGTSSALASTVVGGTGLPIGSTVTFTLTGTATAMYRMAVAYAYTGISRSQSFAAGTGTSTGPASGVQPAAAGAALVAVVVWNSGTAVHTPGAGLNELTDSAHGGELVAGTKRLAVDERLIDTAGSFGDSGTLGSSVLWTDSAAVYG